MQGSYQEASLANLNSGAVEELFDAELKKLLANIADPNTKAELVREITIKIKVRPNETRESAITQIAVTGKYAPIKPHEGFVLFGNDGAKITAYTADVKQPELIEPDNVTPFKKTAGGE